MKGLHQKNISDNRWEVQGHEKELTFGLNRVNFGARSYNPTIGRFDRIDQYATKFSSTSPFTYSANNPILNIDPDGNEVIQINGGVKYTEQDAIDVFEQIKEKSRQKQKDDEKDKDEEEKTPREKALIATKGGFWSKNFWKFAFSSDGINFLIDEIYKVEGSGNLTENAHPVEKVNDIAMVYATGKFFVTIGKGTNAFRKQLNVPKGFKETGQYIKIGAAKAPILTNGKVFISPDITQHNTEGWKMAKSIKELRLKQTRMGTYDIDLNKIKK